ncbi:hypothetical protein JMJ55_21070 [Belnapia sp. T6]|uniref:Uncharacterized protein n=1 Tax=Belnapia mucosa TaxID=2804532 RepID=A0ABS1VAS5_9PROT|nr:hypothetical protein [Belnapia mucosa]MBL6457834.1 hypothetical protein [Belnapia mucosa]
MGRRVARMERAWGGRDDLSRLSDAELDAAINDVQRRMIEGYAGRLHRFNAPEEADEAEAALRKWVEWGEIAARLIAGRTAPRSAISGEGQP